MTLSNRRESSRISDTLLSIGSIVSSVLDCLAPLCVFSIRLVVRKKMAVKRCEEQLLKLEVQATDREENKQIALGTSKLNYLDPRISVAW